MFPPGHFYSPVVDPGDRHVREALAIEEQPLPALPGILLNQKTLNTWFRRMHREYRCRPFSAQPAPPSLYYYENPFFPLADALALRAFFHRARPRRFIEVGSGFSSCAAIDCNERLLRGRGKLTFIDPYPERLRGLLPSDSRYHAAIEPTQLQDLPLELFRSLRANDILFLDSSHVAKTGSDVLDYLFRIFPALRAGVLIHIHDIFFPFEYPHDWVIENQRSWNEAYLLRAFLTHNRDYRILFFSDWFYKCRRGLVAAQMPLCIEHRGGSLWLRKERTTKSPSALRRFFSR